MTEATGRSDERSAQRRQELRARRRLAAGGIVVTLVLLGAGLAARRLWLAAGPPEGPSPVPWDRVACTRCRMLVSEPRFAAQLQTTDGEVLHFDDPGCALLHAHELGPEVRALWFRDLEEDRWLPEREAVFVPVTPTPMGYGLGARPRGVPGALSREAALERSREAQGVTP